MCMFYTCMAMFPVPELMAPPEVSAQSSTSLKVAWSSAEGQGIIARGQVTEYRVNLLTEQTNNPYAPPVISQVRCTHTLSLAHNEQDNYKTLKLSVEGKLRQWLEVKVKMLYI